MQHVVRTPRAPMPLASGRLEVHQIPAWQDNLVWLLVDPKTNNAAAVDGPDAEAVLDYCQRQGLALTTIFNTHTHHDHIGINLDLQRRGRLRSIRVVGAAKMSGSVPGITETVADGDEVEFEGVTAQVLLTEGHIDGHISYVFEDFVFCGDTMFAAGCGYLFDGPPAKMQASLTRLADLPDNTKVCCAHEYTEDNLRFAWFVEPDNEALAQRIRDVFALRARGECSVPSTIAEERATNPFLRHQSASLKARVAAAFPNESLSDPVAIFAATRALKDRKDHRSLSDDSLPI